MGFSLGKYLSCGCNPPMHHTSLLLIRPSTAGQLVLEGDYRATSSLLFARRRADRPAIDDDPIV